MSKRKWRKISHKYSKVKDEFSTDYYTIEIVQSDGTYLAILWKHFSPYGKSVVLLMSTNTCANSFRWKNRCDPILLFSRKIFTVLVSDGTKCVCFFKSFLCISVSSWCSFFISSVFHGLAQPAVNKCNCPSQISILGAIWNITSYIQM